MLKVILEPRMPTNFALISQQQMRLSPGALVKIRVSLELHVQILLRQEEINSSEILNRASPFLPPTPGLFPASRKKIQDSKQSQDRGLKHISTISRSCLWKTVTPVIRTP